MLETENVGCDEVTQVDDCGSKHDKLESLSHFWVVLDAARVVERPQAQVNRDNVNARP